MATPGEPITAVLAAAPGSSKRKSRAAPKQSLAQPHVDVDDLISERDMLKKCLFKEYGRSLGARKSIMKQKGGRKASRRAAANIQTAFWEDSYGQMPRRKRVKSTKPPTEKQLASQGRFKDRVQLAKNYRQKEPGLKWKEAMSKAFQEGK